MDHLFISMLSSRDGLKHMTVTLQKVLSQLVEYFNLCEDELNNTFVGELLRQIINADDNFDNTIILRSVNQITWDHFNNLLSTNKQQLLYLDKNTQSFATYVSTTVHIAYFHISTPLWISNFTNMFFWLLCIIIY